MNLSRVRTIYVKELLDILRDRRTLIATIVVPVVLYPLLMVFSLQAVTAQSQAVSAERITVGVKDERTRTLALHWLQLEQQYLLDPPVDSPWKLADDSNAPPSPDTDVDERQNPPPPLIDHVDFVVLDDLDSAVRSQRIECGLVIEDAGRGDGSVTDRQRWRLYFQPENIRSQSAGRRLDVAFERASRRLVNQRLHTLGVDPAVLKPVRLLQTPLTSSGSILALILPLVLILMTITSAIYPAIDLTAGEHERGTLETLIVCPVPIIELIVGKFLTVTTVALLGATLNLASVGATVYFGGLGQMLAGGDHDHSLPLWVIPLILLSLVPFSVLMSAILVAVCGCARSFKEAQNYITPVIIAVMLPGIAASLPGVKLEGAMVVMPVGNMVLLVRELLSGSAIPMTVVAGVLLSTTLYAGAAVAVAASTFGQEAVLFADHVSLSVLLSRRMTKPTTAPPAAMVCLYVAVLFPLWFYIQTGIQQAWGSDFTMVLQATGIGMPVLFVMAPVLMMAYWKVDVRQALLLRRPGLRPLLAAVVLGLVMWIPAGELYVLQQHLMPTPEALLQAEGPVVEAMRSHPLWLMLLLISIIPATCEELLFRGFLLSGLRQRWSRWATIVATAAAFAVFHFLLIKFSITFVLGAVLAWLAWQSRSIWPAIVAHALHNGLALLGVKYPAWKTALGVSTDADAGHAHMPLHLLALAAVALVLAWWWTRRGADATGRGAS